MAKATEHKAGQTDPSGEPFGWKKPAASRVTPGINRGSFQESFSLDRLRGVQARGRKTLIHRPVKEGPESIQFSFVFFAPGGAFPRGKSDGKGKCCASS